MATQNAKIDSNYYKTLIATANSSGELRLILVDDTTGRLLVDSLSVITPPSGIGNGAKVVTTAGTAVAIASSTTISKIIIRANDTNSGKIYVGGSTVSSSSGAWLLPTESMTLEIDDLASVYIDSDNNGEGVLFTYLT